MARLKLSVILFILAAAAVAPIFALPIPVSTEGSHEPGTWNHDKYTDSVKNKDLPLPPIPTFGSSQGVRITEELGDPGSKTTEQHIHTTHDHKGSGITQVLRNSETTGQHKGSEITKHSNATPGPKPESQLAVPTIDRKHLRFASGETALSGVSGFSSFKVRAGEVTKLAEQFIHKAQRKVGLRDQLPERPEGHPLPKSNISKVVDTGLNVAKKGLNVAKKGLNVAKKGFNVATNGTKNGTKKLLEKAMSVGKPRNTN